MTSKVIMPLIVKKMEVALANGKYLRVKVPVNDVSARRSSQWALVMIKTWVAIMADGIEELKEVNAFNVSKISCIKFLHKGVTLIC